MRTEAQKIRDARYRDANREKINTQRRAYKAAHKAETLARNAAYRDSHRAILRSKDNEYYRSNADRIKARKRKLKLIAFERYGGAVCARCGDDRFGVLTIDHIAQDGAEHRKSVGLKDAIYKWLKKANYPSGFRVLCANCNLLAFIEYRSIGQSKHRKAVKSRLRRLKTKQRFMGLLGDLCVVCGTTDISILTAHHKNNDGRRHRELVSDGVSGYVFYEAILKSDDLESELAKLECRCLSCNCLEEWS